MKFRKKPVVIEAVQWDGKNLSVIYPHFDEFTDWWVAEEQGYLRIQTLEGVLNVSPGDWIIKGVQGEFYPCKPDIFDVTYDRVGDDE